MPPEVTGETAAARHITSSLMVAIVPPSGRLAYVSAPPCCCTIDRAMTTPRPVPFLRVVKNGVPSRASVRREAGYRRSRRRGRPAGAVARRDEHRADAGEDPGGAARRIGASAQRRL